LARSSVTILDAQDVALVDALHHLTAGVVDERDARLDQPLRPEVGIATRDRRHGVDHGYGPAGDEAIGRHPVEILVVDHRDLTRLEPLDEVLGATVDARGAHNRRGRRRAPTSKHPLDQCATSARRRAACSSSSAA
jgi:hypothetical protein